MATTNTTIAKLLRRYGQLLKSRKENQFKVKAFDRAADAIQSYAGNLAQEMSEGFDPTTLPGIGKGIALALREILDTGTLKDLVETSDPLELEIAEETDLNPAEVLKLYKKYNLQNIAELKQFVESGALLAQAGPRINAKIRAGLFGVERVLLYEALPFADNLCEHIRQKCDVSRVEVAGSVRRRRDTVGSIRLLVRAKSLAKVAAQLAKSGPIEKVIGIENDTARFRLSLGVDLIVVNSTAEEWGINLLRLTGSLEHLSQLEPELSKLSSGVSDETLVYEQLGLQFILPELREGRGEVEAARTHSLPILLELSDIRGDLHAHTTYSDGSATVAEMQRAARKKGYVYLAISDHSQSLKIANGLTPETLLRQVEEIDSLNAQHGGPRLLKASEVDILKEGALDFSDEVLERLDFRICSVHSRFSLGEKEQTQRMVAAVKNRFCNVVGHPTGRLLLKRPPYELDIKKLLKAAKAEKVVLEINASPDRLDLSDEHALQAKRLGVPIVISTDAHSPRELEFMEFGVYQARRAWLTKNDVINTRSVDEVLEIFGKR